MRIKISPIAYADVTHFDLAEAFSELDGIGQANFFNSLHAIAASWGPAGDMYQLHAIGRALKGLNGRHVIDEIHAALHEDDRS